MLNRVLEHALRTLIYVITAKTTAIVVPDAVDNSGMTPPSPFAAVAAVVMLFVLIWVALLLMTRWWP